MAQVRLQRSFKTRTAQNRPKQPILGRPEASRQASSEPRRVGSEGISIAFFAVEFTPAFDAEICGRTAPELTGPWSEATVLYTAPEEDPPYDAMSHPELAEEEDRVQYVTYSRATTGWFGRELAVGRVELAAP